MKIKFLGVGSAFTTLDYGQSNMVLTGKSGKKMLIDCGGDARLFFQDYNLNIEDIDSIYISHLHSDHIGGMEWFAFVSYFIPGYGPPDLYMEKNIMGEIWESSLKGGLKCIEGKVMDLKDYFKCHAIKENESFVWDGIKLTPIKLPHITTSTIVFYSYGLIIEDLSTKAKPIFLTTDTKFCPDLISEIMEESELIFHDCETTDFQTTVHAHYDELCTLPETIRKKMWLYHYQPNPIQDPIKDGFKGFVTKGQEFIF